MEGRGLSVRAWEIPSPISAALLIEIPEDEG